MKKKKVVQIKHKRKLHIFTFASISILSVFLLFAFFAVQNPAPLGTRVLGASTINASCKWFDFACMFRTFFSTHTQQNAALTPSENLALPSIDTSPNRGSVSESTPTPVMPEIHGDSVTWKGFDGSWCTQSIIPGNYYKQTTCSDSSGFKQTSSCSNNQITIATCGVKVRSINDTKAPSSTNETFGVGCFPTILSCTYLAGSGGTCSSGACHGTKSNPGFGVKITSPQNNATFPYGVVGSHVGYKVTGQILNNDNGDNTQVSLWHDGISEYCTVSQSTFSCDDYGTIKKYAVYSASTLQVVARDMLGNIATDQIQVSYK
ncbi:MAG TPA: hypothetical protein VEW42_01940 [Candidatus Eisenbacteria bacterium]|nr:hypothetical protein [Candidatus Eisenbacteria bacterium]